MGLPKLKRRVTRITMERLFGDQDIWVGDYIMYCNPPNISKTRYYIPLSGKDRLAAMQSAYRIHETWRDAFGVEVEVRLEGA